MIEAVWSGSALILILLVLRAVFRKRIPQRVQYALWGLVLLRLCLPFSLFESRWSVWETAPDLAVMQREVYVLPVGRYEIHPDAVTEINGQVTDANSFGYPVLSESRGTVTRYAGRLSLGELLTAIWRAGAVLAGAWFLLVNLRFMLRLRQTRRPFQTDGCPLRVYVSDGVRSPCLFGLPRPAVYLTPQAASPDAARCVLAHELAHYRHGDHIWSLARVACLAAYWWNPLVWAAAVLSRIDSELACDEAAVRSMDASERLCYGRVLVALIPEQARRGDVIRGAACMAMGRKSMKERVLRIVHGSKTAVPAVLAVLIAAFAAIGCTFSGAAAAQEREEPVYTLTHLQNGRPQSAVLALKGGDAELAAQVISQSRLVSAAWEGPQPEALADCWRITVTQPDGTLQQHYAWQVSGNSALADGSAVLQSDGRYSRIGDELFARLTALTEDAPGHENLDLALRDAILSSRMDAYTPGVDMVNAESHVILGRHIEGDFVTVYAVVRTMWAGYEQGEIAELTGSHMPAVITLEKGSLEHAMAGGYSLAGYWTPEDGSRYEPSVREKFPEELADLALDLPAFAELQSRECWRQVAEEGRLNALDARLNGLLDSMMSSPSEASGTAAYIEAHREEYDEFLSYGDDALRFVYREFGKRLGARGLRGALLQCAMEDLLGSEAIPFDASDGLDYYEKFWNHALNLLDSTSKEFVAEHYPKTYLFLQMTTALGPSGK